MTATYSTDLRLTLPATGDNVGTWGPVLNANMGTLLEQAICGVATVAITDANYTLTTAQGAVDQARNSTLLITGVLTANRQIIIPSGVQKLYFLYNGTTGGFPLTVTTTGGSSALVYANTMTIVYCDGTNVIDITQLFAANSQTGYFCGVSTGTANTYAINVPTTITTPFQGMFIQFLANIGNTATSTLTMTNALGQTIGAAYTITKQGNSTLQPGDINTNQLITIVWDGSNAQMASGSGLAQGTVISSSAPTTPYLGQGWFNPVAGALYYWGGSSWTPVPDCIVNANAPTTPFTGQLWYNTGPSALEVWNGTAWVIASSSGGGVSLAALHAAIYS